MKAPHLAAVGRRPARLLARREQAQGMVEFALALPIFLMILAATVQISILLTTLKVILTAPSSMHVFVQRMIWLAASR